ncbi:uncharacterized protein IUM83_19488 [Phytophthora cinnamomi]|uniref:uncharacterized protein n=1 Tax=Phytophthora cinnamomi TaxID=4785 RepID=UPI0035596DC9|nr:hypothetical protein IUM83_19488 [Phytophthora cinnamomi]
MQDTERCDGVVGTTPSAAQVFCALWRQVHDELVRQSAGETSEPLRASNAAAVNGVDGDQGCTSDDSGGDDLLALLDDARRKELHRLRQRRCRAKRKALQAGMASMNNVHADEVMDTGEGVGGAGGSGDRVLDVDGRTGSGCCDSLCGARCRGVDSDAGSGDQVLDNSEQERRSGREALRRQHRCGAMNA